MGHFERRMLFFFNFLKIFGLVGVAADLLLLLPVYYLAKEYFCWLLLLLLVVERRRCFLSPLAILVSKVVVVPFFFFKSNFKFTRPSPFDLRKYTSVSLSLLPPCDQTILHSIKHLPCYTSPRLPRSNPGSPLTIYLSLSLSDSCCCPVDVESCLMNQL